MIKITGYENEILMTCPVSEFIFGMGYCEYKIPFYVKGIRPPRNVEAEMRKSAGRSSHKKEEKIEIEKIEKGEIIPVTREQMFTKLSDLDFDLEFTREDIITKLNFRTTVDNVNIDLTLSGRADKISRENGYLIVYEDKFPKNPLDYVKRNAPFSNQILQALVYLNSRFKKKDLDVTIEDMFTYQDVKKIVGISNSFEIPHKNKKWVINIRDKNANIENNIVKTFFGEQTERDKIYLDDILYRFVNVTLGYKKKVHHDNARKCNPCEYASVCRNRVVTL